MIMKCGLPVNLSPLFQGFPDLPGRGDGIVDITRERVGLLGSLSEVSEHSRHARRAQAQ